MEEKGEEKIQDMVLFWIDKHEKKEFLKNIFQKSWVWFLVGGAVIIIIFFFIFFQNYFNEIPRELSKRQETIEKLSQKYHVKVIDEEINARIKKIFLSRDQKSIEKILEDEYGFGLEEYTKRIIIPVLQYEKLKALSSDIEKEIKEVE